MRNPFRKRRSYADDSNQTDIAEETQEAFAQTSDTEFPISRKVSTVEASTSANLEDRKPSDQRVSVFFTDTAVNTSKISIPALLKVSMINAATSTQWDDNQSTSDQQVNRRSRQLSIQPTINEDNVKDAMVQTSVTSTPPVRHSLSDRLGDWLGRKSTNRTSVSSATATREGYSDKLAQTSYLDIPEKPASLQMDRVTSVHGEDLSDQQYRNGMSNLPPSEPNAGSRNASVALQEPSPTDLQTNGLKVNKPVIIFPADKPGLFFMPGITSLPLLAPFPLPPFFPPPPSYPPLPQPPFNIPSLPLIQPLGHITPKSPLPVPPVETATPPIDSSQDIPRTLDKCRKLFSNSFESRRSKDLGEDNDADYMKFFCTDPCHREEAISYACKCHENSNTAPPNGLYSEDEIPSQTRKFICRKHGTPRKHKKFICSAKDKRCSCQKDKNKFIQPQSLHGSQKTFCPNCQCRYCCLPTSTFAASKCCITRRNVCDGSTCQDNVTHINASLCRSIQLCLRNSKTKKNPKVKKYNLSLETLKILGTLFSGTRSTSVNCREVSDCHKRTECSCSHKGLLLNDISSTAVHQTPTSSSCTCGAASSSSMKQKVPISSTIKCSFFGRHLKQLLQKFDKELCNLPDRGTFQSGNGECDKVNKSCPGAENKCCGTEDNDLKCNSARFTCNRSDAIFTFCDDSMFNHQNCSRVYNGCQDIRDSCGYFTCTKTDVCDKMTSDNTCAKKSMCDKMSCDKPGCFQSFGHCCGCKCECCRITENPCIKEIKTIKEVCSVSSQTNITPEKTSKYPSPADNPDSAHVFQPIAQENSSSQEKPHASTGTEKETHNSTTTAEIVDIEADFSKTDTDCQDPKLSSEPAAAENNSVATNDQEQVAHYLEQELVPETEIKSINFQCFPAIENHLFHKSCVLKRKIPCSDRKGQSGRKKPCNGYDHQIERENHYKYGKARSNDNKYISHENPVTNDKSAINSHDGRCSAKEHHTFSNEEGQVLKPADVLNKEMKKIESEPETAVKSRKESKVNGKSSTAVVDYKNESKTPRQPRVHRCKDCQHEDSYTREESEQNLGETYTNHQPGNDEYDRLKTSIFCTIKKKSMKIKDADFLQESGISRHDKMYRHQRDNAFSPCGVCRSQPPCRDDSHDQSIIFNIPVLDPDISEIQGQRGGNTHISQHPRTQTSTHSNAALSKQPGGMTLSHDDHQQVKRNNTFACKRKHKHNKIESSLFGDKNMAPSLPGECCIEKHTDYDSKGDFVESTHIGNQQVKQDEHEQEKVATKTTESRDGDQFSSAPFGCNIRSKTFKLPNVHKCRDCQIDAVDIIKQHEFHNHKGYISNRKQLKIERELDNNKVSIFCSIKNKSKTFKDSDDTQEYGGSHYNQRDDKEKIADVNSRCGVCRSRPSCVDKTEDVESTDTDKVTPSVDRETVSCKVEDSVGIIYAMSNSKYKDSVDPKLFGSTFSCKDNSLEQSTTCDLPDLDSEMSERWGQKNLLMDISELLRAQANTNKDSYNPNHNASDGRQHGFSNYPPTSCQSFIFQCNCCSQLQENRADDLLDCSCTNLGHHLLVCRPCSRQFGPNHCLCRGKQHIHTNYPSNDCVHSDECIVCQCCRMENCRFGCYFIVKSNCNTTENSQNKSISYLDPQNTGLIASSTSLNTLGAEQPILPHTHSTKYRLYFECTNAESNQQQTSAPCLACFQHIFNTFAPVISELGWRDNAYSQGDKHRTKGDKSEQGSRDNAHSHGDKHRTKGDKSEQGSRDNVHSHGDKHRTKGKRSEQGSRDNVHSHGDKHHTKGEKSEHGSRDNVHSHGDKHRTKGDKSEQESRDNVHSHGDKHRTTGDKSEHEDIFTISKTVTGSNRIRLCLERGCRYNPCKHTNNQEGCQKEHKGNLTEPGFDEAGSNTSDHMTRSKQAIGSTVGHNSKRSLTDLANTIGRENYHNEQALSNRVINHSNPKNSELCNIVSDDANLSKQALSNCVSSEGIPSKQELSKNVRNCTSHSKQELSNNVRNCSSHSKQELSNNVRNCSSHSKQRELSNNVRNCSSHSKREPSNNVRNCSSHSKREPSNNVRNCSSHSKRELSHSKEELINNVRNCSSHSKLDLSNNDSSQRKPEFSNNFSNDSNPSQRQRRNSVNDENMQRQEKLTDSASNVYDISKYGLNNTVSKDSNTSMQELSNVISNHVSRREREQSNVASNHISRKKTDKINDRCDYSKISKRDLCDTVSKENNEELKNTVNTDIIVNKHEETNDVSNCSKKRESQNNIHVVNDINIIKRCVSNTASYDSERKHKDLNNAVCNESNFSTQMIRETINNDSSCSKRKINSTVSNHNNRSQRGSSYAEFNSEDRSHTDPSDTDPSHNDWKHKNLRETESNHRDRKHKDRRETESNHRDRKHTDLRETESNHRDRKHTDLRETESNHRDRKHTDLRETESNHRDRKHTDLRETESNHRDRKHTDLRETESNHSDRKYKDLRETESNHRNRKHTDVRGTDSNHRGWKHTDPNNEDPNHTDRTHKDQSEAGNNYKDRKHKGPNNTDPNHNERKRTNLGYADTIRKKQKHKDSSEADHSHKDVKYKDQSDADNHKARRHKHQRYATQNFKDKNHKDSCNADPNHKDRKHKDSIDADPNHKNKKHKDPSYKDFIDKDEKHKDSSYTDVIDKAEKHEAPSYADFVDNDEEHKDPSYTEVIDKDKKHKDQRDRDEADSGQGVSGRIHSNHHNKNHDGCTLNYSVSFSDGGKQRFETHNNITYTMDQTVWSVRTETNIHPIPNSTFHETSNTPHEQGRIDIGPCDLPCSNCQCQKKRKRKLKMISDEDDSVISKKYEPIRPEYCQINKEPCYICADPQVIETIAQEISHVNQCPATGSVHENQSSLSLSESQGFPSRTFTTRAPQKRKRKHHTNIAHPCKWQPNEIYPHFYSPESSQIQGSSNSLNKEKEKPHSSRNHSPEFFSNSFRSSGALNGYPKCQTGEPLFELCSQCQNLSYQRESYMDVQPTQLSSSLCPSHSQYVKSNSKESLGSSHRICCSRTDSFTCSSRLCNLMPCLSCGQERKDLGRQKNYCEIISTSAV